MPPPKTRKSSARVRILIADHQALVRSAIRLLLETKGAFHIVAEAADGEETLKLIAATRPDVALVDVAMPKLDGLEVTKRIRDSYPATRVLALTALEGRQYVRATLAAGAAGYVPKTATAQELMDAIRVVTGGCSYVHPRLAAACAPGADRRASNLLPELTSRETEVMRRIALGYSLKEAAAELNISAKTVETHKSRAIRKLGVTSRVDLLRLATEKGWVVLGSSSDGIAAANLAPRETLARA
jgi:DNA-binding NarL/FixJ family response regulator